MRNTLLETLDWNRVRTASARDPGFEAPADARDLLEEDWYEQLSREWR